MGLDAVVYCDCFETGRLREQPPAGMRPFVRADGSLDCDSGDLETLLAFDQWHLTRACEHELGVLVHHWIGNIDMVAALREELIKSGLSFPVILNEVLYSGTHCGDVIEYFMLPLLRPEVESLADVHCQEPPMENLIRRFEVQMRELLDCAMRLKKPISF